MKRRLLSILLALVLTLALLPTAALAENVNWIEIGQGDIGMLQTSGYYRLKENIDNLNGLYIGNYYYAKITLDLNGFTLTGANEALYTLWICQTSTLTLIDSGGGGKVESSSGTAIKVDLGSTFTMDAGEIRGKSAGIVLESQFNPTTFTMNGGSVTGGVYVGGIKSKMELNNGTVDGINLNYDSTLYANGGTVTGPSVLEGTVLRSEDAKGTTVFDGLVVNPSGQEIPGTLNGGTITGDGFYTPFLISNAEGLKWFRDYVNSATGEYYQYSCASAKLTEDIDLGDVEWTPIMPKTISIGNKDYGYSGIFDGNGHTISGLNVTGNFKYAGLFGVVTHNGTIKNLTVAGNVSPNNTQCFVGGIVGRMDGNALIRNCSNHCSVAGAGLNNTGGIAGFIAEGTEIIDCYNVGRISPQTPTTAGGIVGHNNGTISNCYNVGTVSTDGMYVGEIVGINSDSVKNCYYLDTAKNKAVGNNLVPVTNVEAKTEEEFADGTVLKLLMADRPYADQPWDSKCRLVTDVNMTLPVFKYQAPEEPAPSESSSGSRFSYSTISASAGENGSVSPSGNLSVRDDLSQTFVFTPDKGYRVKDVLIDGQSVGALRSYTFATVRKNRTVEVIFEKIPAFVDVPAGSYYEDAVNWAVENWITEGTSDAYFSPDAPCTRAQAVTFLWRAAGCPAPSSYSMPFADVKSGSYYETAVLWALENNIVSGTSEKTFEPDAVCTRAQIVCFLFRYKAANGMDAVTLAELLGGFADSAEIPAYARPALNWAISADVLQGSGAKLLPNEACTRAQIVTLLYRTIR